MNYGLIDIDMIEGFEVMSTDSNVKGILLKLSNAINRAIVEETFYPPAFEELPKPWLSKVCGVSMQEVDDLNLVGASWVIYTHAINL